MVNRVPHEYLRADKYYESHFVSRGRTNKTCEFCGEVIPIGMPHDTHKFYGDDGDWPTYPTHKECSKAFENSLRTDDDPEKEYN